MFISRSVQAVLWLGALVLAAPCLGQNHPPAAPVINEPATDGQIVNPADVHMETGPFSDPDPGDQHLCSDWEIWTVSPMERVWITACIGGVERVHTHLGDGVFENSHAGRSDLLPETDYLLRVRHRDDSGAPNDWSDWSERLFQTGTASTVFPLELVDVADSPVPQWNDTTGAPLSLPAGSTPGSLALEDSLGDLLLELRGLDGNANEVINPPSLADHVHPRLVLQAGSEPLSVPDSDLTFTDEHGEEITIYLPSAALDPGAAAVFWISSNGSTYVGDLAQEEPDFSVLARGAPVPWTVAQPGFKVEVVATGFQLPVNIAFIPNPGPNPSDPLYYVTELYGTIKVVLRDGTVGDYATGLLNFNPTGNFPGSGEQGLTGIAVDPSNGDVFAGMLYSTNPDNDNAAHYPKVVRFTSSDGGHTAANKVTILDMVGETQGQSHQISNFSFGPDGKLYVHMGDGFDASKAQNLNSFRGKILRLEKNGTAPIDNPFYDAGDGITARDYIYAYGVRNPFGGAWRESDGFHYTVENGPSVDRFSKTVRGRNYLWADSDASMRNYAIFNWDPAHAPVNIAFVQASTFNGSGFPADRFDRAYITESGPTWASGYQNLGKRITEWILDADGNLVDGERDVIVYNGSGKGSAVGLTAGPDGLYFSDLYKDQGYGSPIDRGANILRLRYVGTADFVGDVRAGQRPLAVHFTDLSDVPGASEWQWTFGDGGSSTEQNPTHTYVQDGAYTVRLAVRGSGGTSVEQKNSYIKVGEFPTVAMIGGSLPLSPADQAVADFLSGLGYDVTGFDDDRGARPSASEIAAQFDAVVVSSTIASANIAGDFRDEDVPLVFWENALLQTDRVPLADNHAVQGGAQTITILDNSHPITQGLNTGDLTVFTSPANMSVGRGNIAPGATVLATRSGAPGDAAIIAADAGALLLGGHIAPARRAFLYLEDASWLATTDAGRTILEQTMAWATGFMHTCPGDFNGDGEVDTRDVIAFLGVWASGDVSGDFNGDWIVDSRDVLAFLNAWAAAC